MRQVAKCECARWPNSLRPNTILNMWLTARALNIGMGWVSILKPKKINKIFDIDKNEYKFIAYLCFGYAKEFYNEPELKKLKWNKKRKLKDCFLK